MKKEIIVRIVYSIYVDKLYTFDTLEEMMLSLWFIKYQPK